MGGMADIYDPRLDANYRTTRKKPFKGAVKVYCVSEDDEDREHVLYFETNDLTIDVDTDFESVYNGWRDKIPMMTKYKVSIGELNKLDDKGTVMRVENFLKDEVYDEPTYSEEDYE